MSIRHLITILTISIAIFLAFYTARPIHVKSDSAEGFSAERAMSHLRKIADHPHFIGTSANQQVKQYIISEFQKLGYQVEEFTGYANRQWGNYARYARTENLIITKPGNNSQKKVVVMGHYDSVWDSPGAADDGHAVAGMLEVAALIKDDTFDNDIVFLITDGEETGLHGAKAYVAQYPMDEIGILLNFEARGNKGVPYAFEWGPNNYELVRDFGQVVSKPIASSLSNEIYNRMPNGSDFTEFKDRGVPGINMAFIDGFAYYHSPIDHPDHLNINTFQHAGDYMYHLILHYADKDLSDLVEKNASFFNIYTLFLIYSSSWDWLFLVLAILFSGIYIFQSLRQQKTSIRQFLLSLLFHTMGLVIITAFGYLLQLFITAAYPHYFAFYSGQFYNHKAYFFAAIGLTIFFHYLWKSLLYRKQNKTSYLGASLLLWSILTVVIFIMMPTGTYLFGLPLILASTFGILSMNKNKIGDKVLVVLELFAILIVIGLWLPTLMSVFLAFSLSGLAVIALLTGIFLWLLTPILSTLWRSNKWIGATGLVIYLIAFIYGHFTSHPTDERPLPSILNYYIDQDTDDQNWYSSDKSENEGNKLAFADQNRDTLFLPWKSEVQTSNGNNITYQQIAIQLDTIHDQKKYIRLIKKDAPVARLHFPEGHNINKIIHQENVIFENNGNNNNLSIEILGFPGDTIPLTIICEDNKKTAIIYAAKYLGMPENNIPDTYIRKGNSTVVTMRREI